ncbi:MAG: tRNA (guanosine(46)-N7)-methyltransferase TrmB [Prevotella sp.]|nr:tRNA (guanosine(46)-N7)-methyltransferase TrmB [Prevotella sp.]
MGKGKLEKFAELETFGNVFQYPYSVIAQRPFEMKGRWRDDFFENDHPIVLELGCGKGEYAVELARLCPEKNFIGVDIKGARLWTGASQAIRDGLKNVAFLRTNIEFIDHFFAADEVQEIWLTFSDPQMKNPRKRLTSTFFLERYRRFLVDEGIIHLKTDSNFLFTYTDFLVQANQLPLAFSTTDLYHDDSLRPSADEKMFSTENGEMQTPNIQTYYEQMWLSRGLPIKYMQFRLPHDGELREPDVEIELDDYRSYHRDKRSSKERAK